MKRLAAFLPALKILPLCHLNTQCQPWAKFGGNWTASLTGAITMRQNFAKFGSLGWPVREGSEP